jgi:hypothetical protein
LDLPELAEGEEGGRDLCEGIGLRVEFQQPPRSVRHALQQAGQLGRVELVVADVQGDQEGRERLGHPC